jgi:integrase
MKTKKQILTFSKVAKEYLNTRVVSDHYKDAVYRAVKKCKYLTAECLNNYIKSRVNKVSSFTVKTDRTILLSLWKFAYETDMIDHMPKNIIKLKMRKSPTKAWTIDECKALIQNTYQYDNKKNRTKVSVGLFLRVWLILGYESGARFGDVFNFKWNNIENNVLRWTMSKTGDPMTKILSDKLVTYINELKSYNITNDDRILGWICSKRQASRRMKEYLTKCGLDGSSKFLRRSSATHIEIDHPGMAKLHLGHRTSGLAEKNYLDFGQIRNKTPVAPSLLD